jgi:arsenite methyltransferase
MTVAEEKTMTNEKLIDREDVREIVRKKYGEAALRVRSNQTASCCGAETASGSTCCGTERSADEGCCENSSDPITSNLYSNLEASEIPEAALLASLGCGNPTALAQLSEGEIVLDLGSGGGIDVLLSAKRVGPSGFAYGLDMTDEMLALAEANKAEAGVENVKFLKGHIEAIPLPDHSVDVIISNCVINLSANKDLVLQEAFRVLKPGGRFAVSDVVVDGALPEAVRRDMELYVGCVAGALEAGEYRRKLEAAGFVEIGLEPTRRYEFSQLEGAWAPKGVAALSDEEKRALDGKIYSAFVRARKPR